MRRAPWRPVPAGVAGDRAAARMARSLVPRSVTSDPFVHPRGAEMKFLISVLDDKLTPGRSSDMVAIGAFNDRLRADGHWV